MFLLTLSYSNYDLTSVSNLPYVLAFAVVNHAVGKFTLYEEMKIKARKNGKTK